ncbi:alkaline phosphatase family protein [Thalassococcus sp. S3]|uniref:alkaline phosphatase family protein n=1 Tax=Thalassococcus sp. S3 TaxID=2017482 RepID=UPI0010243CF8|nr:alkaline phosphatase family protein [Thalassococcus sp. S3]QBF30188.1 nucleotide pyrophosphatase [Thalassococcus sp. S3]
MTDVDRVVVIVFDGLRPDVIENTTPNLHSFAHDALWFTEARSVFPSMTRVATTSFATGHWPMTHGIVNNAFHIPELVRGSALNTASFEHLSRLKAREPVVTCESLGHALAAAGKRMEAIHCGSAGAAYLVNHDVAALQQETFSIHGEASTQTPQTVRRIVSEYGPLPPQDIPKLASLEYANRVFVGSTLTGDVPDVALLWLVEPDTTWHHFGLGSPEAHSVLRAADEVFGNVLDAISRLPGRTTLITMSDHGQITTASEVDITAAMQADGLPASHLPGPEHRLGLTRGSMSEIRSLNGDSGLCAAACDWLMNRDDIGLVFARDDLVESLPGTLPQSLVMHGHDRDAELYFTMRASDETDKWGLPGQCAFISDVELGCGIHGGLNRYELTTTLIVKTPDGRRGRDASPVGLVDIAPTVAELLGVRMSAAGAPLPLFEPRAALHKVEVASTSHAGYSQELRLNLIDGRAYIDHGNRLT